MNHELAQKLKDAGFPLIEIHSPAYQNFDKSGCVMCGYPFLEIDGRYYMQPVLDILIDACGEKFSSLIISNSRKTWSAWERQSNSGGEIAIGHTPEEAVAMLWLALNPKK